MKKTIFNIAFILSFVLLVPSVNAFEIIAPQNTQIIEIPQDLKEIYDTKVDAFLKKSKTPGVQIAILLPNNKIYSFARGLANIKTKEAMTTEHILKFGSVSKAFTAFRIQKFYEAGLLKRDDNVLKYLNNITSTSKNKDAIINAQQLINHSSGLEELFAIPELVKNIDKEYSEEKIVKTIFNADLIFKPGTEQKYNNSGFIVADMLMQELSTTPASAEHSSEKMLTFLGMDNIYSMYPPQEKYISQMAQGYSLNEQKEIITPTINIYPSFTIGSGDLIGRAKNLVFLKNALPTLLPMYYTNTQQIKPLTSKMSPALQESIANLPEKYQCIPIFPHTPLSWEKSKYNLYMVNAINIVQWDDGLITFGKDGTFPGFAAQFLYAPETDFTIVVLSNNEKANTYDLYLAKELLEITAKNYDK